MKSSEHGLATIPDISTPAWEKAVKEAIKSGKVTYKLPENCPNILAEDFYISGPFWPNKYKRMNADKRKILKAQLFLRSLLA